MKKKLALLFGAITFIAAVGAIIIMITNPKGDHQVNSSDGSLKVVTTFYPVYLIGLNISGDTGGIEVKSLTKLNTGCLHDYQLTTEDMKLISNADVLVINGGGMEGFLEDVASNYPKLTIIDASEGISMLRSTDETIVITSGKDSTDQGEYNAHVWLDPQLYIKQIENVRDGLIKYINNPKNDIEAINPGLANRVEQNAQVYIDEIKKLDYELNNEIDNDLNNDSNYEIDNELNNDSNNAIDYEPEGSSDSLPALSGNSPRAVIFHDSFAYLAERAGIKIAFTVPLDSDTALSAGEIATIIDAVKKDNVKYLFTEEQYSDSIAKRIEAETAAKVYIIDSVVTGDGSKDAYITAMQKNLEVIEDALH